MAQQVRRSFLTLILYTVCTYIFKYFLILTHTPHPWRIRVALKMRHSKTYGIPKITLNKEWPFTVYRRHAHVGRERRAMRTQARDSENPIARRRFMRTNGLTNGRFIFSNKGLPRVQFSSAEDIYLAGTRPGLGTCRHGAGTQGVGTRPGYIGTRPGLDTCRHGAST